MYTMHKHPDYFCPLANTEPFNKKKPQAYGVTSSKEVIVVVFLLESEQDTFFLCLMNQQQTNSGLSHCCHAAQKQTGIFLFFQ